MVPIWGVTRSIIFEQNLFISVMKFQHTVFGRPTGRQLRYTLLVLATITIVGICFSGTVVGQSANIAQDTEVSQDGTVELVFTPTDEDHLLSVSGNVAGWTVEEMRPDNTLTSPSDLPNESSTGDNWATIGEYTDGQWAVTVSPPDDVEIGDVYEFSVDEQHDGETVATDTFTIEIVESDGDDGDEDDSGEAEPVPNDGALISDSEVATDGSTELVFVPDDTNHQLSVSGDTAGWTVEEMTPDNTFTSPPNLPTESSADDSWGTIGAYSDGVWELTVSPPTTAEPGESYSFEVTELDGDNNQVAEEAFTIEITETDPVPDWVDDADDVTATQYNAFNTDGESLTGDEIRTGVNAYITSLPDGEVNGVEFSGNDIRALVSGYINNELL